MTGSSDIARVSSLIIYPIKSCAGIHLDSSELAPSGLQADRRYMLVDEDGQFLSARTHPSLLRVQTALDGDQLQVEAAEHSALVLPLHPEEGPEVSATVWRDSLLGREVREGSIWFSSYLGQKVRLVFQPDAALRQVNPERGEPGDRVSLADGYPLLLTVEASLDDLNSRLESPVPMSRFRPNVVVTGFPAFAEDTWAAIRIGNTFFRMPKLCDRCVMTTVDASTGEASKEPLRTLAGYRRWNRAVWFGANLIPESAGTLRVGDALEVTRTRAHPRE